MSEKRLLVEIQTFKCDPYMLRESLTKPNVPFRVKGVLQRAGVKNQNGRIYPKEVLLREAQKYSETFVRERRALGELDHPESSVVNLKNVSHNVTEMHWEGDDLVGTVEVLTTPSGNILRDLFRNGINVGISSRALGSLNKISENTSMVGEDLELIAFDFVSNPSTAGAFMFLDQSQPMLESVQRVKNPTTNKWVSVHRIVRDILNEIG
jgi:hypothetical protein